MFGPEHHSNGPENNNTYGPKKKRAGKVWAGKTWAGSSAYPSYLHRSVRVQKAGFKRRRIGKVTEDLEKPDRFVLPDDSDEVDRNSGRGDEEGHPDDQRIDVEGEEDQEQDDEDEENRNAETHLSIGIENELNYKFFPM